MAPPTPARWHALIREARAADPTSWRVLHDWLRPQVEGFLRGQGADDPPGLTNETFLRVFRSIDGFEGEASAFRGWVFTIARNLLADERRRAARRPRLAAGDGLADRPDPTDVASSVVGESWVRSVLAELTPAQREVLVLRALVGLTAPEVAAVLGRPETAVRSLQHRAVQAILRRLARDGGLDSQPIDDLVGPATQQRDPR